MPKIGKKMTFVDAVLIPILSLIAMQTCQDCFPVDGWRTSGVYYFISFSPRAG